MRKGYIFIFLLLITSTTWAQYNINAAATNYTENFNTLTNGAWSDNVTVTGWYARTDITWPITTYGANTGTTTTGALYAFGVAGVNPLSDRALGYASSNAFTGASGIGKGYIGWRLKNNTGGAISSITITWTGEQWRKENNAASHTLELYYQTGTTITDLITGTWTAAPSIFTSPIVGATAPTALDGNSGANRVAGISVTINVAIAAGDEIMLRWEDLNDSGNDHLMAIDDVTVNATAAPPNTITTGAVTTSPFILVDCITPGPGLVAFTSTDVFSGTNTFTAQLSDDIGSFATPINIGSLTPLGGTAPSGSIPIIIPIGTVSGTGYRIRVVSDMPAVTGSSSSAFQVIQSGACASSHTDSYRSVQSGNWGSTSTWESQSADNPTWIAATLTPTSAANTITIQNTHTVTVAANTTADQVSIQSGGILEHSSGIFTIEDGAGDDIDILSGGVFLLSANSVRPVFGIGSPTINNNTGGIIRVSSTGQTGAAVTGVGVNVANYVYQHQSILEYTLTSPFSSSLVTYFPNVDAVTIPIFRTTNAGSISVGATLLNTTIINGVFDCRGAGVTWQGSATKTFRNGIIGSGPVTTAATCGQFFINGLTAELGGTGTIDLSATPGLPLQIGSASGTNVTVTSDKSIIGNIALLSTNTFVHLGANSLTVTGAITGGGINSHIVTDGAGALTLNNITSTPQLFPIGPTEASYNPLTISHTGAATNFSARVEVGINPGIAVPSYGINRTWNIKASAVAPNVTVVYQYAAADANINVPQPQPMEILMNDGIAWSIIVGNTNISPVGSDPYTVTTATALGINNTETPYVLGKEGGWILPLDCIIACHSAKQGNSGLISWDVSSCSEVNRFELQRSVNGGAFQAISTIIPGNDLSYHYIDAMLSNGTNLYRIKIISNTGAVKYSNTVAILNDTKGILITGLSPNPVNDQASLVINAAKAGSVSFVIYDIAGRPIKQWKAAIGEGSNNINVNTYNLTNGIYHLSATMEGIKTVIRFVKQ